MSKRKLLKAYSEFAILTDWQTKVAGTFFDIKPHWLVNFSILTWLYSKETNLALEFTAPVSPDIHTFSIHIEQNRITIYFLPFHFHIYPHEVKANTKTKSIHKAVNICIDNTKRFFDEEWFVYELMIGDKKQYREFGSRNVDEWKEFISNDDVIQTYSWRGTYNYVADKPKQ
jgi:hypothetical protein